MSENRRYYWLKLQETFFEDDTIDFIESQENGEKYVLFYLKLCLKALKNEGKLIRYVGELLMPYDEAGIAKLTKTNVDTVRSALILFSNIGLIKRLETGEIYLTQLNELIGSETSDAQRKRKQRIREKKVQEIEHIEQNMLEDGGKCHTDVTPVSQNGHVDIELDKDIDIELDKDSISDKVAKKTAGKPNYKLFLNTLSETDNQNYKECVDEFIKFKNSVDSDFRYNSATYLKWQYDFAMFSQRNGIRSENILKLLKSVLLDSKSCQFIFKPENFLKRYSEFKQRQFYLRQPQANNQNNKTFGDKSNYQFEDAFCEENL